MTSLFPDSDEHFEGDLPEEPSFEEKEHTYTVNVIVSILAQAARGQEVAWSLSTAMASIMCPRSRKFPIDEDQADSLRTALLWAHVAATEHLPIDYARSKINAGFSALSTIITEWADVDGDMKYDRTDLRCDAFAYARIFRNDLHNFSLTEEIAQRAKERHTAARQATYASLLAIADGYEKRSAATTHAGLLS